ncbi:DUF3817 domain-containing protein [Bacillus sp. NP157]|nr:DUF3817 domain-containing protein [Bacillus sp. NP157]
MKPVQYHEDIVQIRLMRVASILEGCTLLALLCIAVPLKHIAGLAIAVRVMGPIHGLCFVLYLWTLIRTVSAGGWPRSDVLRMVIAAIVPFGAFVNDRLLARRQRALELLIRNSA